jgi:predicted  nucleic acid-binding Zn-ribbon protein
MNTEFYRLIGSLKTVDTFIRDQYHNVEDGTHGSTEDEEYRKSMKHSMEEVKPQLDILNDVVDQLLKEQAKISHAMFDFRRAMSRNAEAFYHAINKLRRKAPEWQIMDEDLLRLIESYQATASSLFFGGDDKKGGVTGGSSSS